MGKLPGLQVARAFAALGVVYFHSWVPLVRFPEGTSHPIWLLATDGWFGVDLFFAISGYVIGLVASKEAFSPAPFLIKRAFRLYPLWLLTLTTFAVLTLLWRAPTETETLGYFLHSASLIETKDLPYYSVGWSLQHEITFYALAAIIVPFFGLRGLAVALITSSSIYWLNIDAPWYITKLPMYHPEFLAGLVAFLVRDRMARFGAMPLLAIGTALIIIFLHILPIADGRPYAPISLFFLISGFANMKPSTWTAPLEKIGDASYSLYLVHPLVNDSMKSATKLIDFPIWAQEPIRYTCIGLAVAVALLSWRYFESPIINAGNRFLRRRKPKVTEYAAL